MSFRVRLMLLLAALCLVEVASYWKLSHWLAWSNEPWLAFTTALAFVALLLAAIIALGSSIPADLQHQFRVGGVWLFSVQGLANVLIAYQYGLSALPIAVVTQFFGVDPAPALKGMAVIQGATLSICSISFWSVIAHMLQSRLEEQQRRQERLHSIEMMMEEDAGA